MKTEPGVSTETVRRRPAQERSRIRFDAIVEAAGQLIGARGLEPVTMTDIAAEADMAITAVYRYFPNKQAVVHELALRTFESDAEMALELSEQGDRTLHAWVSHAVTTYCRAHMHDSRRRQIRAAIHADEALAALNMADSEAAANVIADALAGGGADIAYEELVQRALLVVKLIDGAMNLARNLEPREVDDALDRFADLASWTLLHQPDSWPPPS